MTLQIAKMQSEKNITFRDLDTLSLESEKQADNLNTEEKKRLSNESMLLDLDEVRYPKDIEKQACREQIILLFREDPEGEILKHARINGQTCRLLAADPKKQPIAFPAHGFRTQTNGDIHWLRPQQPRD